MSLVTVRLCGGCGNQLFQAATGYALALDRGAELRFDIGSFRNDPMRMYNLELFQGFADTKITPFSELKSSSVVFKERMFTFDPELYDQMLTAKGDIYIDGYWQTEEYFKHRRSEILKLVVPFNLPFENLRAYASILASSNPVFLTIRRTDYLVKQDFHGVLPLSYYTAALDHFNAFGADIYIFTDDIPWVQDNFVPRNSEGTAFPYSIVGTFNKTTSNHLGREDADLFLASHCRGGIMANSTFSWWSAWLGKMNRMIAPANWFGPAAKEDPRDIVPKRWTKIDNEGGIVE